MNNKEKKVAKMIEMGGKEWIKGSMHRIYFNIEALMNIVGLKCSYYNTGNISSATFDGEVISNSRAKKIIDVLSDKFYFDCSDEKIYYTHFRTTTLAASIIEQSLENIGSECIIEGVMGDKI
jgi:hypothetical protein